MRTDLDLHEIIAVVLTKFRLAHAQLLRHNMTMECMQTTLKKWPNNLLEQVSI